MDLQALGKDKRDWTARRGRTSAPPGPSDPAGPDTRRSVGIELHFGIQTFTRFGVLFVNGHLYVIMKKKRTTWTVWRFWS